MADPSPSEVLIGGIEKRDIILRDYDPTWPATFQHHAAIVARALGPAALRIEHIGSTAVPGLAAKPIIDLLLVVANSADEPAYLPHMESAGYVLRVREPDFHQHRMFRTPQRNVHIHVFSPDSPEIDRTLAFRDRLRASAPDRLRYEQTKRTLAAQPWPDMNAYAAAKTKIIESTLSETRLSEPRP